MKINTIVYTLSIFLFSLISIASENEYDKSLKKIMNKHNLPGLVVASFRGDKTTFIKTYGQRKLGYQDKISIDDKIHIGSCAKSMTATLIAILIEKGRLSWTKPLSKFFPDYKIHDDLKNVNLEILLSHRSGLQRNMNDLYQDYNNSIRTNTDNRTVALQKLLVRPPSFGAERKFHYSNNGYVLAGHIAEFVMEKSYEELISEYLFKPLGMSSCGFGATSKESELKPSSVWGHQFFNNNFIPVHGDNPLSTAPAGTIHCNVRDWVKYLKVHSNPIGMKLISKKSLEKLHTIYPAENSNYTYGGWTRLKREWGSGYVLYHSGTNTLNYVNLWVAPLKNKLFLAFTNSFNEQSHKATNEAISILMKIKN